jgi:hypothetical protein
MSGIPQFNYPRFTEVAEILREEYGHEVLNPAEMDSPEAQEAALASPNGDFSELRAGGCDETWGDFLREDVKIIADEVDGVVLLENWEPSRGVRLEAFVAASVMKPVYQWVDELGPMEITPATLMHAISHYTIYRDDDKEKRYG